LIHPIEDRRLADVLTDELQDSQGELFKWFARQIPHMPPKAYCWGGEMEETARAFADLGLPPRMLEGAAALYRLVGQREVGAEVPDALSSRQRLPGVFMLAQGGSGALQCVPDGQECPGG